MSIHLAFAWLKERGFVEKYNPNHYPKGSPMGGKFAPKSMSGGGGGDVVHVPYRGTRVYQRLVASGIKQPLKPEGLTAKEKRAEKILGDLVDAQKKLVFAQSWPLRTAYNSMVEKQFPAKIEKLIGRLKALVGEDKGLKNYVNKRYKETRPQVERQRFSWNR